MPTSITKLFYTHLTFLYYIHYYYVHQALKTKKEGCQYKNTLRFIYAHCKRSKIDALSRINILLLVIK